MRDDLNRNNNTSNYYQNVNNESSRGENVTSPREGTLSEGGQRQLPFPVGEHNMEFSGGASTAGTHGGSIAGEIRPIHQPSSSASASTVEDGGGFYRQRHNDNMLHQTTGGDSGSQVPSMSRQQLLQHYESRGRGRTSNSYQQAIGISGVESPSPRQRNQGASNSGQQQQLQSNAGGSTRQDSSSISSRRSGSRSPPDAAVTTPEVSPFPGVEIAETGIEKKNLIRAIKDDTKGENDDDSSGDSSHSSYCSGPPGQPGKSYSPAGSHASASPRPPRNKTGTASTANRTLTLQRSSVRGSKSRDSVGDDGATHLSPPNITGHARPMTPSTGDGSNPSPDSHSTRSSQHDLLKAHVDQYLRDNNPSYDDEDDDDDDEGPPSSQNLQAYKAYASKLQGGDAAATNTTGAAFDGRGDPSKSNQTQAPSLIRSESQRTALSSVISDLPPIPPRDLSVNPSLLLKNYHEDTDDDDDDDEDNAVEEEAFRKRMEELERQRQKIARAAAAAGVSVPHSPGKHRNRFSSPTTSRNNSPQNKSPNSSSSSSSNRSPSQHQSDSPKSVTESDAHVQKGGDDEQQPRTKPSSPDSTVITTTENTSKVHGGGRLANSVSARNTTVPGEATGFGSPSGRHRNASSSADGATTAPSKVSQEDSTNPYSGMSSPSQEQRQRTASLSSNKPGNNNNISSVEDSSLMSHGTPIERKRALIIDHDERKTMIQSLPSLYKMQKQVSDLTLPVDLESVHGATSASDGTFTDGGGPGANANANWSMHSRTSTLETNSTPSPPGRAATSTGKALDSAHGHQESGGHPAGMQRILERGESRTSDSTAGDPSSGVASGETTSGARQYRHHEGQHQHPSSSRHGSDGQGSDPSSHSKVSSTRANNSQATSSHAGSLALSQDLQFEENAKRQKDTPAPSRRTSDHSGAPSSVHTCEMKDRINDALFACKKLLGGQVDDTFAGASQDGGLGSDSGSGVPNVKEGVPTSHNMIVGSAGVSSAYGVASDHLAPPRIGTRDREQMNMMQKRRQQLSKLTHSMSSGPLGGDGPSGASMGLYNYDTGSSTTSSEMEDIDQNFHPTPNASRLLYTKRASKKDGGSKDRKGASVTNSSNTDSPEDDHVSDTGWSSSDSSSEHRRTTPSASKQTPGVTKLEEHVPFQNSPTKMRRDIVNNHQDQHSSTGSSLSKSIKSKSLPTLMHGTLTRTTAKVEENVTPQKNATFNLLSTTDKQSAAAASAARILQNKQKRPPPDMSTVFVPKAVPLSTTARGRTLGSAQNDQGLVEGYVPAVQAVIASPVKEVTTTESGVEISSNPQSLAAKQENKDKDGGDDTTKKGILPGSTNRIGSTPPAGFLPTPPLPATMRGGTSNASATIAAMKRKVSQRTLGSGSAASGGSSGRGDRSTSQQSDDSMDLDSLERRMAARYGNRQPMKLADDDNTNNKSVAALSLESEYEISEPRVAIGSASEMRSGAARGAMLMLHNTTTGHGITSGSSFATPTATAHFSGDVSVTSSLTESHVTAHPPPQEMATLVTEDEDIVDGEREKVAAVTTTGGGGAVGGPVTVSVATPVAVPVTATTSGDTTATTTSTLSSPSSAKHLAEIHHHQDHRSVVSSLTSRGENNSSGGFYQMAKVVKETEDDDDGSSSSSSSGGENDDSSTSSSSSSSSGSSSSDGSSGSSSSGSGSNAGGSDDERSKDGSSGYDLRTAQISARVKGVRERNRRAQEASMNRTSGTSSSSRKLSKRTSSSNKANTSKRESVSRKKSSSDRRRSSSATETHANKNHGDSLKRGDVHSLSTAASSESQRSSARGSRSKDNSSLRSSSNHNKGTAQDRVKFMEEFSSRLTAESSNTTMIGEDEDDDSTTTDDDIEAEKRRVRRASRASSSRRGSNSAAGSSSTKRRVYAATATANFDDPYSFKANHHQRYSKSQKNAAEARGGGGGGGNVGSDDDDEWSEDSEGAVLSKRHKMAHYDDGGRGQGEGGGLCSFWWCCFCICLVLAAIVTAITVPLVLRKQGPSTVDEAETANSVSTGEGGQSSARPPIVPPRPPDYYDATVSPPVTEKEEIKYPFKETEWTNLGSFDIDPLAHAGDGAGSSVSLSKDGSRLAVGSPLWGIDGLDGIRVGSIAVYDIISNKDDEGAAKQQQQQHRMSIAGWGHGVSDEEQFGSVVKLNNDGTILAVASYVVEKKSRGRGERLKGYKVSVFGVGQDWVSSISEKTDFSTQTNKEKGSRLRGRRRSKETEMSALLEQSTDVVYGPAKIANVTLTTNLAEQEQEDAAEETVNPEVDNPELYYTSSKPDPDMDLLFLTPIGEPMIINLEDDSMKLNAESSSLHPPLLSMNGIGNRIALGAPMFIGNTGATFVYDLVTDHGNIVLDESMSGRQANSFRWEPMKDTPIVFSEEGRLLDMALSGNGQNLAVGLEHVKTKYRQVKLYSAITLSSGGSNDIGDVDENNFHISYQTWVPLSESVTVNNLLQPNSQEYSFFMDDFGAKVDLSYDGSVLAVGAPNSTNMFEGTVAVFQRKRRALEHTGQGNSPVFWEQVGDVLRGDLNRNRSTNPPRRDLFGQSLSLSADGRRLSVGAPHRSHFENVAEVTGATFLFEWSSSSNSATEEKKVEQQNSWSMAPIVYGTEHGSSAGYAVNLSADGSTVASGIPFQDACDGRYKNDESTLLPYKCFAGTTQLLNDPSSWSDSSSEGTLTGPEASKNEVSNARERKKEENEKRKLSSFSVEARLIERQN